MVCNLSSVSLAISSSTRQCLNSLLIELSFVVIIKCMCTGAEVPSVPSAAGTSSAEGERRKTKVVYDTKKKKKSQQTVERQESETTKDGQ